MARRMKLAGALVEELGSMEVKITESGKSQYAAWREGAHDDLVLAVALAVWRAKMCERSGWGTTLLV